MKNSDRHHAIPSISSLISLPIGSMGRLYIYPHLVDFFNDKLVGKYTSPMDPTVDGQNPH